MNRAQSGVTASRLNNNNNSKTINNAGDNSNSSIDIKNQHNNGMKEYSMGM